MKQVAWSLAILAFGTPAFANADADFQTEKSCVGIDSPMLTLFTGSLFPAYLKKFKTAEANFSPAVVNAQSKIKALSNACSDYSANPNGSTALPVFNAARGDAHDAYGTAFASISDMKTTSQALFTKYSDLADSPCMKAVKSDLGVALSQFNATDAALSATEGHCVKK